MFNFIKTKKKYFLYGTGIVILIAGGIFIFLNGKKVNDTIVVSHTDFVNKVSVSGNVVAAQEVNLSFQNSGVVKRVFFKIGQGVAGGPVVKTGTMIAEIDTKDADKDIHDAEVALESAKLSLKKLQLTNSNKNLVADLEKAYDDAFNFMSNAFVDFSDIITGLDDVLNENNLSDSSARTYGSIARSYRDKAEELYYQTEKSYKNSQADFRLLSRDSSHALIETAINATYKTAKMFADAIKSARNFVDYMAEDSNNSSEFTSSKNTIAEYTDTMNDHLSALSFAKDDVNNYEEAFFDTDLNIKDLELTIKQKENNLQDAKNKLSDYRIRAPFDGVVTKIDAKVGEIAPANEPLVTMMNAGTFQIESYVPEVNIALINIGDEANVTLDAYGKNVLFYARVVSIDPAETIRDGVSTYKIKLQFSENDNRIKSGMTANVSILIFSKPNVIVVPGGVVFEKGGKKYIQIKKDKKIINKEVTLGDASPLGQVEVVSGLADGDTVILNPLVSS